MVKIVIIPTIYVASDDLAIVPKLQTLIPELKTIKLNNSQSTTCSPKHQSQSCHQSKESLDLGISNNEDGCFQITFGDDLQLSLPSLYLKENKLFILTNEFGITAASALYKSLENRATNLSKDLLIMACKAKEPQNTIIWDLTAGLGKDGILLAKYGYMVTMVEKNPLLAAIIYYQILVHEPQHQSKLTLVYANSLDFVKNHESRQLCQQPSRENPMYNSTSCMEIAPDVIYLDPMFADKKSAKAKKAMQLIALLNNYQFRTTSQSQIDTCSDEELFIASYQKTKHKIIVKRDNKQAALVKKPKVSFSKNGKTIRYDVYLIN